MKLYDKIPIKVWKEIAYAVQRLDISTGSDIEFEKNLKKLQKLLFDRDDINISLDALNRHPDTQEEIDLATLLQAIYSSKSPMKYKKAYMYEKIQMLSELGVKNISFNPVAFNHPLSIPNAFSCSYQGINNIGYVIHRCYTNGTFKLNSNMKYPTEHCYDLDMQVIDKANYTLISVMGLNKHDDSKIEQRYSEIMIKNFNGDYPSKNEFFLEETPNIIVPKQTISPYEAPYMCEQFEPFDTENLVCKKRLTRTKNNQYYYKEYKNN